MLVIWALLSSALVGLGHAQTACSNTLSGAPGRCINIYNCTSVVLVLREQRPLSQETVQRLQASQCGFEGTTPKICCADHVSLPPTPPTGPPATPATGRPGGGKPPGGVNGPGPSTSRPNPAAITGVLQRVAVGPRHPKLNLLPTDSCGVTTFDKIVNGKEADQNQIPWIARIGYETRFGESYRCGGSVISKRYVLTAAHCVTKLPNGLKLKSVLLGELDANSEIDCVKSFGQDVCSAPPQSFGIEQAIPHPQYNPTTIHNDIALLRLNRDADFSVDSVRPICLPIAAIQFKNLDTVKAFTVAGWGTTENGSSSQKLLFAYVPPVNNQKCKETHSKQAQIIESQICAGGSNQDSCDGDSGGPLMVDDVVHGDSSPRSVLVGVVSFGPVRCGTKDQPGVYTRVGYYVAWILENMRP
ncbi:melanization protease 1-like [Neocloeon triangulifer]|uniref:melanization protease 1-like n=1 Tax=Neocloeon triangulifer TaxID=2078957 RepID=UPI00286F140C|nr:melanization protease 1-like [Neocloeon triangulifer]